MDLQLSMGHEAGPGRASLRGWLCRGCALVQRREEGEQGAEKGPRGEERVAGCGGAPLRGHWACGQDVDLA